MANSILGDVNGDGKIDVEDMILISAGNLTTEQLERADVNEDGEVGVQDMIKIRNHITGRNILRGLL